MSDLIPRRPLGRTGEDVSVLGLGGFHVGMQEDERESIALVQAAVDAGITFVDNCWDYNDGQSEVRVGKALAGGRRDRVFLMTKVDGRDRESARRQIDESLRRLRTDRIDLLQLHEVIYPEDPDRVFGDEGAFAAILAARDAGKVRFIGFTGHKSPDIHLAMIAAADRAGVALDTVQMPLNVLDAHHDSFEQRVLPALVARGIAPLGMKPFGDGYVLDAKVASPEECLRYAMSIPGVAVTITGIDAPRILEQDLVVARGFRPMSPTERANLLARTGIAAHGGRWERYKTSDEFDGTRQNPQWLGRVHP